MAAPATALTLLDAVQGIASVIQENVAASEQERKLSQKTVDAMTRAQLYRMCKPRAYGGLEVDAVTAFRVFEAVGRLHAAAAWNLGISVAGFSFISWLADAGAHEILSSGPDARLAGAFAPPGRAIPVEGGYRITGRWGFGSGGHQTDWFLGGAFIYDGGGEEFRKNKDGVPEQVMFAIPASEVTIPDSWHTLGMRGTGSHDFTVTDAFVPERRTGMLVPLEKLSPSCSAPIFRMSLWFAVTSLAAPALGSARSAIDALVALGSRKTPNYTGLKVGERPVAQLQLARAEATLGAARSYMYHALEEAWETVASGQFLSQSHKIKLQLATSHAIEASAAAVDLVHAAAGTSSIKDGQTFEQNFRDVHTITQHAFGSAARLESAGKLLFGQPTDWAFFSL